MRKLLFFLFCLVNMTSCSNSENIELYSTLNELDKGHYDNISIGDSASFIIEHFRDSLILSNKNELQYFSETPDSRIEKREIRTALDRELVYEITLDFYLTHDSLIEPFFNECKSKLDQIYGSSGMDEGYAAWNTSSIHKKVIEIELFDESINSDLNMVSINFYEDFDKSFYAE